MPPRNDKITMIQSPHIEDRNVQPSPNPADDSVIDAVADHFALNASNTNNTTSRSTPTSANSSPFHSLRRQEELPRPTSSNTSQLQQQQTFNTADQIAMTDNSTTVVADKTYFGIEMPFDIVSAAYAALVATGGIIGYVKAGSIPSLAAGLTFGGILGIGAYLTSVNPENYYLTYGTSTALGALMGYRFINSGKFMPAGLISLLSLGMVIRYSVITFTQAKSHSK